MREVLGKNFNAKTIKEGFTVKHLDFMQQGQGQKSCTVLPSKMIILIIDNYCQRTEHTVTTASKKLLLAILKEAVAVLQSQSQ